MPHPLRFLAVFACAAWSSATAAESSATTGPTAPIAAVQSDKAGGAKAAKAPIRIDAGAFAPHTDAAGNTWLADQGFVDGDIVERESIEIANTKTPSIYRTERYSMTAFSYKLPNGKYTVKLHFAETFEGIEGPGQRVFSFSVEGRAFKDFDVWVKSGGPQRAHVESVDVDVADGKLDITFTPNVENPEINALEIIPAN